MKNYHLLVLLIVTLTSKAQTTCEEANSYLVSAYSHVKNAYDSNNITHLKYFSNRSLESFKLSKKTLKTCGCESALKLANKSIELLVQVEHVETFEDGRFYVKRARALSKESVIEIDKCSAGIYTEAVDTSQNQALTDLQNEQQKLKLQQDALKLKEGQIKAKLAEQEEEELRLKKTQLILSYKTSMTSNIKSYNEILDICDCAHDTISFKSDADYLKNKSIEDIKIYYLNNFKNLATTYQSFLEHCKD